jgi:hypothetical protein
VPRPQRRPKRRTGASPKKRRADCSSSSTACPASPSSEKATVSTMRRDAPHAVAALSRFAPPLRRARLFAAADASAKSVTKLTTACGLARCARSRTALPSRRRHKGRLPHRARGGIAASPVIVSVRRHRAGRGAAAWRGPEHRLLLRRGFAPPKETKAVARWSQLG